MKLNMYSQRKTTKLVYIVGTIFQVVCFVMPFSLVYFVISNPAESHQTVVSMTRTFYICYPILIIATSVYLWLQSEKIESPIDKDKKKFVSL